MYNLKILRLYWKHVVIVVAPLALLSLAINDDPASRCAYVVLLMAIFWITAAIPLVITALFPVAFFPLLSIMSTECTTLPYMKETNMMFIGGLIIAVAFEEIGLHRRMALLVLMAIRGNPKLALLGGMFGTMFISMFVSNAAACAMTLPINMVSLQVVCEHSQPESKEDTEKSESKGTPENMELAYLLGTAYASTIGGCGTLTGTGPNLYYLGLFNDIYDTHTPISYTNWAFFNIPLMLCCLFLTWLWLQWYFIGLKWSTSDEDREVAKHLRLKLKEEYQELGPTSFGQWMTLFIFVGAVLSWFFSKPRFMTGWADLYENIDKKKVVKDSSTAIVAVILLFIFPRNLKFIGRIWRKEWDELEATPSILDWKAVHAKTQWDVIFLLGGSYAMSAGINTSKLSLEVSKSLRVLEDLPQVVIVLVVILMTSFMTEVVSNTAVGSIFLPLMNNLSHTLKVNPVYLTLPCVIAASHCFMLPMGTPPNAIAMGASHEKLTISKMAKAGIVPKLLSAILLFTMINIYAPVIFDFQSDYAVNWAQYANFTGKSKAAC